MADFNDLRAQQQSEQREPLIISYTNLLHQFRDPSAEPVRAFVKQHADDTVFVRQVETLNRVFRLKEELVHVK